MTEGLSTIKVPDCLADVIPVYYSVLWIEHTIHSGNIV